MSSFAADHLKAQAYDQLANLAITAKVKALRAGEAADIKAILDQYFQESLAVMRRTGLALHIVDTPLPVRERRRA